VYAAAKGDTKALDVFAKIHEVLGVRETLTILRQMTEMNLVGSNASIALERATNFDIDRMIQAVRTNDAEFVATVNQFTRPESPVRMRK